MNDYEDDPDVAEPGLWDESTEQAAIGSMLLSRRVVDEVAPTLKDGAAFYRPAHQTIYQAILTIHDTPGRTADPIKVAEALRATGDLQRCGGPDYLHRCVSAVPIAANGPDYADIIVNLYELRQIEQLGMRLIQRARLRDTPAGEIASLTLSELQALLGNAAGGKVEDLSVAERWPGFMDELEDENDPRAIDTPWSDLNEVVQLKPKQVTVVGAATSGGKTLLGLNQAAHVAFTRKQPVLVVSMEMGGSEVLARLAASEGNIDLGALTRRTLGEREWQQIARINERMTSPEAATFIIDDSPTMTIPKIESRIRWMDSRGSKPVFVMVDYAQLVTPIGPNAGKNRVQDVAAISLGLKHIADEFDVPVMVLAQFNRGAVGRQPLATDFKDSSQIEQDASNVLLLHRELDEEGNDTGPNAGKVKLIVAKNRNGLRGVETWLSFQGKFASLRNLTTQTPPWSPGSSN
jgi:replicative DNA helicase